MSAARRRGTTLIEVLFGLVILATLLATAVTARGRFLRQAADAQRKARLIEALDAQLDQWFAPTIPAVPLNGSGTLDALPGGQWRTQSSTSTAAAALGCTSVHVEASDDQSTRIAVDLLVRTPRPPA